LKLSNNYSPASKRKIKNIGFICTSLDNVAGGLERQIVRTCNSLAEYNYNIYLISYDNNNAKSFYEISRKVKWIKCGRGLEPHKGASPIKRLRQIIFLRKKLINNNITNLVTFHHGLFPRSLLASLFLDIRKIVSERNSLELYKYIKLRRFNLGFVSMLFADFITIQLEGYRSQYPICLKNKIIVIPNIIKTSFDKNLKPNLYSNIISMVGRLSEQKNFEPMLYQASIQKIEYQNYKITIAGEGPLRSYFENKYNKLIINSYLELSGNVKNIDMFLSKASIFCLPSLWEGYPNSLVEALRIGMPIITTPRMANLKEFIEDDINGYIVEDKDLLSSALKLLKDKDKLKKMSENSKNKFLKLTYNDPIDKWKQLLKL
tara:strand:- start:289 stop:1413 length:1125 start_codon:yes stop_codon:yes gene_type:complete